MLLALSACAGAAPVTTDARPTDPVADPDGASGDVTDDLLVPTADARWGDGRAVAAATAADGTTAILTTVEVHIARPDGTIAALDDTPRRRTPLIAISDDATTVATVDTDPPVVTWYDVAAGDVVATATLPDDARPSALHFVRGTGTLLVETDRGPLAWPEPPTADEAPVRPATDAVAGPSALLSGGVAVTPLLGTRSVVMLRGEAMVVVELELAETAALQRAAASPDGQVLVVEAAIGTTEFDRPDQLLVLDRQRLRVAATIPLGRDIPGDEWTVTDTAVAVAQANRIELFDLDGSPARSLDSGGELGIGRLAAVTGGVVNAQSDGTISFWSGGPSEPFDLLASGRVTGPLGGDVAGRHLTVADSLGRVRTWSGADGTPTADVDAFEVGELTGVAIRPDGALAAGTTVGRVVLTDLLLDTAELIVSSDDPARVDSVAFHPASGELATGRAERRSDLAFDDTLTFWRLDDRSPRFRTGGEAEDVPGCAFFFHRLDYTADGALLATASHDRTVGILDGTTGGEILRLPARVGSILDLAFTADGGRLVVSADDNTIEVWDTDDWSVATTISSPTGGYSALATLPGGRVVVADVTGGLTALDLATGEPTLRFDALLPPRPTVVASSADGALVASPLLDDAIGVWSTATGEWLATLRGHTDAVTGLAFTADGSSLVSSSADGTLRAWPLVDA